ncbi:unnamed protein product [Effrenium voratum]|uniref:Uncharacterized protein n=1 Tax=Effrenium voratum TaxID=2562239 RepID=A0AA36IVG2_9DINO|nr:unnamed protein product [Effrenium voratum]
MALELIPYKRLEDQDFSVTGEKAGKLCSTSYIDVQLIIPVSEETLTLPLQTCTKVQELKSALSAKLGFLETDRFQFVVKQGCTFKRLQESDQVRKKMTVHGLKTFKPPLHKYPHPYGIIGAGYNGIKTALYFLRDNQTDFTIFDRYDKVGGHAWLESANKTTRLQTEFATYHVWFGQEWSSEGSTLCGGPPVDWEPWPARDRVVEHFELCAREYGIYAHCQLGVNVESADLIGREKKDDRYYQLTCQPVLPHRKDVQGGEKLEHHKVATEEGYAGAFLPDKSRKKFVFSCSCFCIWPGNLINPRQIQYAGEDLFDGFIEYGVEMRCDYTNVTGKRVIIHGHGAFTMENIRTCCEYGAMHIDLVCRKRNLTCPRVVSWFINQASPPITGAHCLNLLNVAYKLCDYDVWDMHSVHGNAARTTASLAQRTRFGIGDIYFLAAAYGIMEVLVDNIKRCSGRTVHLESGRRLEDVDVILKCVGMLPDATVDRVVKAKYMRGFWINGDPRRYTCADPDGIYAANFAATTIGPGAYNWVALMKHVWDCPNEWIQLDETGHLATLPEHFAGDPDPDSPAYFINARHSVGTMFTYSMVSPAYREKTGHMDKYKHWVAHYVFPVDKLLAAARAEWDAYEVSFREMGMVPKDAPLIPYPYTKEFIEEQYEVHRLEIEQKEIERGALQTRS